MAKIEIGEIAGSGFFASEENFMDSMRDLTADELKISGGSGHGKGGRGRGRGHGGSGSGSGRGHGGGCGCGSYC
jgi:hypothetical protein